MDVFERLKLISEGQSNIYRKYILLLTMSSMHINVFVISVELVIVQHLHMPLKLKGRQSIIKRKKVLLEYRSMNAIAFLMLSSMFPFCLLCIGLITEMNK